MAQKSTVNYADVLKKMKRKKDADEIRYKPNSYI